MKRTVQNSPSSIKSDLELDYKNVSAKLEGTDTPQKKYRAVGIPLWMQYVSIVMLACILCNGKIYGKVGVEAPSIADGQINGHGYVDLGLPSGTKWATCNVGADSPTDYGDYFAWGETTPKSTYTSSNSRTYNKSSYNHEISGNSSLDAATANWGSRWKMPTKAQMQELIDNCDSKWTSINGVNGRLFTSKRNGKSIFLPAAGWRYSSGLDYRGEGGCYWSGSPNERDSDGAYHLYFYDSDVGVDWFSRYYGRSVRGVVPE